MRISSHFRAMRGWQSSNSANKSNNVGQNIPRRDMTIFIYKETQGINQVNSIQRLLLLFSRLLQNSSQIPLIFFYQTKEDYLMHFKNLILIKHQSQYQLTFLRFGYIYELVYVPVITVFPGIMRDAIYITHYPKNPYCSAW